MKLLNKLLAWAFFFLILTSSLSAMPRHITLSAKLCKDGKPLNRRHDIKVSIRAYSDDKVVWTQNFPQEEFLNGVFNVNLGDVEANPISTIKLKEQDVFIRIECEGDFIDTGFSSTPFALVSDHSFSATEISWTGVTNKPTLDKLRGTLTEEQVPSGFIKSDMIKSVSANKIVGEIPYNNDSIIDLMLEKGFVQGQLGNQNIPDVIEKSLVLRKKQDDGFIRLTLENGSGNNRTGVESSYSFDEGNCLASVRGEKNNVGQNQFLVGTETNHDVVLYRSSNPIVELQESVVIVNNKIDAKEGIAGNGSELTELNASQLTRGTISPERIGQGVITNAMLAGNIDGSKIIGTLQAEIQNGSITKDHINGDTKIPFLNLAISKDNIVGLGVPAEDTNTQLTEEQVINYIENSGFIKKVIQDTVGSGGHSLQVINNSPNNSAWSDVVVKSDNNSIVGFLRANKDDLGVKTVDFGSDTDVDVRIIRNGSPFMVLKKNGSQKTIEIADGVSLAGGSIGDLQGDFEGITRVGTLSELKVAGYAHLGSSAGTKKAWNSNYSVLQVGDSFSVANSTDTIGLYFNNYINENNQNVFCSGQNVYTAGWVFNIETGLLEYKTATTYDDSGDPAYGYNTKFSITKEGAVSATSFSGNGASVTNINANNISSGVLSTARIPSIPSGHLPSSTTFLGSTIENSEITSLSYSKISSKPAIAYSSAIAADDFSQTEVNNLRAGKLDNGTTPWTNASSLSSGTIPDARLSSSVSILGSKISNVEITDVSWSKVTGEPSFIVSGGDAALRNLTVDNLIYSGGESSSPYMPKATVNGSSSSSQAPVIIATSTTFPAGRYNYTHYFDTGVSSSKGLGGFYGSYGSSGSTFTPFSDYSVVQSGGKWKVRLSFNPAPGGTHHYRFVFFFY
jgi:hypothetical protein